MRLASNASGMISVAPAALSSSRRESSGVRTSTGTSVRKSRRLRRMASEVRVSENEMTTALALARPTSSSTCSSAESPYTTGCPICRAVRVRTARQMGQPVVYGDSADEQVLEEVGLANANAVVISFSDTRTSLAILRSLRLLRTDVPVLVRTPDDSRLLELKTAGATEVVPEAFEASLMLASHVLMTLKVPPARAMRSVEELRANRYEMLRTVIARGDGSQDAPFEEQVRSVVVPPGSWCIGKAVDEVRSAGAEVAITGIRREGILGRDPPGDTRFHEGDVVVIYGTPDKLEHAEAVLLAG